MHRIYQEELPCTSGVDLIIGGEEAHHAVRVKRVRVGEAVGLLDGRGGVGEAVVTGVPRGRAGELVLRVVRVERIDPPRPALEVCTAVPKRGRLEEMLDGLSQVGAASWRPLAAERAEAGGEPRSGRLRRVVEEAAKQCGRAWFLEVGGGVSLEAALRGECAVMADSTGEAYEPGPGGAVTLLIGPEGGWTDAEREAARRAGVRLCRFGPHVMRIETAAIAAAAVILDRYARHPVKCDGPAPRS